MGGGFVYCLSITYKNPDGYRRQQANKIFGGIMTQTFWLENAPDSMRFTREFHSSEMDLRFTKRET
jgi:hypothetical protein